MTDKTETWRVFWPCKTHGIQKLTYHSDCAGAWTRYGTSERCTCECHA